MPAGSSEKMSAARTAVVWRCAQFWTKNASAVMSTPVKATVPANTAAPSRPVAHLERHHRRRAEERDRDLRERERHDRAAAPADV